MKIGTRYFSFCKSKMKVKLRIHLAIPKSFFLHLLAIFVVLLYKWIDFNQYCRVKDDTFSNFPSSSLFFSIHAFSSIVWKVLLFIPFQTNNTLYSREEVHLWNLSLKIVFSKYQVIALPGVRFLPKLVKHNTNPAYSTYRHRKEVVGMGPPNCLYIAH